jgi:hypothetical protein
MAGGWGSRKRLVLGLISSFALVLILLLAGVAQADEFQKLSRFGPDSTEASNFERIDSLALDQQEGFVYVLDRDGLGGALLRFDSDGDAVPFSGSSPYIEGNKIGGLSPLVFGEEAYRIGTKVAVDSTAHRFYVTERNSLRAFEANGEPAEFSAGPGAGSDELPGFTDLNSVAVDDSGNIYTSDYTAGTFSVFAPSGALLTSFPVTSPFGLAVNSTGTILALPTTPGGHNEIRLFTPNSLPVSESTTYTESAFASSGGSTSFSGVASDAATGEVYALVTNFNTTWVRRYDSSGTLVESIGEPGTSTEESSALGGLATGIAVLDEEVSLQKNESVKFYTGDFIPESDGTVEESKVALFGIRRVIDAPDVTNLRASNITSDSARLLGSVDPNLKSTTYRFEYGLEDCSTSVCSSVPVGEAGVGSGLTAVAVSQVITGLAAGTLYHYRIVAKNELGEDEERGTFSTAAMAGTGFDLSDDRVWEMVSPPNKAGASLKPRAGLVQAAAGGDGIVYPARGSIEVNPEGNRSREPSSIFSRRGSPGWSSKDITPPNSRTAPLSSSAEFKLFSPELKQALLLPHDGTQLSPLTTERTPYLWEDAEPPVYTPLVTGKEGVANVPPGTEFGGNPLGDGPLEFAGANRDLTDIVLIGRVPLAVGAPTPSLYHWKAGQLSPINVLPDDEAVEPGEMVKSELLGSAPASLRHAVSEDGSRIFWSGGGFAGNTADSLYLRDTEDDESVRLDVKQPGGSGFGQAAPRFQAANPDGTTVVFKDSQQLTEDASPSGSDLYRCEISPVDPSSGCATLTDITGSTESDEESAEVLGLVSGLSEDTASVYFVAQGILDPTPNFHGDTAQPGQPNLYLGRDGEVRFIATLSEDDAPNWALGGGQVGAGSALSAAASPSGRYLAFMSERSLTDQAHLDAETAVPVQQAFVYDSATDEVVCASCDPLGAAPTGGISGGLASPIDSQGQWIGQSVAAVLPQPIGGLTQSSSPYQPRAMLDNGRLFFNAFSPLVAADANGQWDAYQFEPIGVGDCSASTNGRAVVRADGGCISLLSSGTGTEEAAFLDASVSGDDVFFFTPAQLSVRDKDFELDVYDARVGGVADRLLPESECTGEACRPAVAPPATSNPLSSTFAGSGNVKSAKKCPKGKRKVRRGGKTKCIRKKAHQRHHKKASQNERGSR